jgi:hypothetical protein
MIANDDTNGIEDNRIENQTMSNQFKISKEKKTFLILLSLNIFKKKKMKTRINIVLGNL